jgi:hypothetical protein
MQQRRQLDSRSAKISCFYISHCLRYSIVRSNHALPHLQDTILRRHWFDFSRRHQFRNRYEAPDTKYMLSFKVGVFEMPHVRYFRLSFER